jgi:hypothetical protein
MNKDTLGNRKRELKLKIYFTQNEKKEKSERERG